MVNWKTLIGYVLKDNKEYWKDVVSCTLTDKELKVIFDSGYGGSMGKTFTLWTENYVYFPAVYDGAEWVESVPRHPNGKATGHVGGE